MLWDVKHIQSRNKTQEELTDKSYFKPEDLVSEQTSTILYTKLLLKLTGLCLRNRGHKP